MSASTFSANNTRNQLSRLIHSLNKGEKRNFKLYVKRGGKSGSANFVRLFDLLDRVNCPNDEQLRTRLGVSASALVGLKHRLYQEVLSSLRLIHVRKEIDIELREQLDFTRILYGKGHYLDALRTLERARVKALQHSQDLLHLEILEFQKLIEARHVTLSRQVKNKMEELLNDSERRCYSVLDTSGLFSLNIQIHGHYINHGHGRTPQQRAANQRYWNELQPERVDRITSPTTFTQKANRQQAMMWFRYIQLDFSTALAAAEAAYNLFSIEPRQRVMDPDLYLRCLYYSAMLAYLNEDVTLLDRRTELITAFITDKDIRLNANSQRIGRTYSWLAAFNGHFLSGRYAPALKLARTVTAELRLHSAPGGGINDQRRGLFLYKIAAAHFLNGDPTTALDFLNEIINMRSTLFRDDLLINTRLLHLLCHYELNNRSLLEYHLTALRRLLRRSRESARVHELIVVTLGRLLATPQAEYQPILRAARETTAYLRRDPFERKAMLYLDLGRWLDRLSA